MVWCETHNDWQYSSHSCCAYQVPHPLIIYWYHVLCCEHWLLRKCGNANSETANKADRPTMSNKGVTYELSQPLFTVVQVVTVSSLTIYSDTFSVDVWRCSYTISTETLHHNLPLHSPEWVGRLWLTEPSSHKTLDKRCGVVKVYPSPQPLTHSFHHEVYKVVELKKRNVKSKKKMLLGHWVTWKTGETTVISCPCVVFASWVYFYFMHLFSFSEQVGPSVIASYTDVALRT